MYKKVLLAYDGSIEGRLALEHYNRATSLTAAESFRQLIRQYEKK
jgi:hypothetical protein